MPLLFYGNVASRECSLQKAECELPHSEPLGWIARNPNVMDAAAIDKLHGQGIMSSQSLI